MENKYSDFVVIFCQRGKILHKRLSKRGFGVRFIRLNEDEKIDAIEKGNNFVGFLRKYLKKNTLIFTNDEDLNKLIDLLKHKNES